MFLWPPVQHRTSPVARGQTYPRHRCVNESFKRCDAGTLLLSSCRFHRLCPACLTCWSRCFPYTWLHNAHNDDGPSHNSSLFQAQRIVRGKFAKTIFRQTACVRMMRRMSELQWVHAALHTSYASCHHRKNTKHLKRCKGTWFHCWGCCRRWFFDLLFTTKTWRTQTKRVHGNISGSQTFHERRGWAFWDWNMSFPSTVCNASFFGFVHWPSGHMANKSSYAAASFPPGIRMIEWMNYIHCWRCRILMQQFLPNRLWCCGLQVARDEEWARFGFDTLGYFDHENWTCKWQQVCRWLAPFAVTTATGNHYWLLDLNGNWRNGSSLRSDGSALGARPRRLGWNIGCRNCTDVPNFKCFNTNNALTLMASHSLVHPSKLGCWKQMSKVGLAKRAPQVKPSHGLTANRGDWRTTCGRKTLLRFGGSASCGLENRRKHRISFSQPERHPTRWITDPRHPSDFADMLGALFAGNVVPLRRPVIAFLNQFNESKLRKRKMNADLLRVFPTTCFKTACIDWWTVYTDLNCAAGICSNTWQTVHRNKEEVIHHYTCICQIQGAIQVHSSRHERCQSPSKRELKRLHTISRCSIKSPYYTSLMHHLPDGVHELNDIHLHVSLFLVSVLWIWSFNWNLLCPPTKNKVCCTTLLQAPSTRIAMSVQVLNIVKTSKLFLTVVLFGVRIVLSFCPDFFLSINIRALDYVVET